MATLGTSPAWRLAAVVAPILTVSCSPTRPADPVILALGDQEVRLSEFERYADQMAARGEGPLDPAVRQSLLEAFVERRVTVLEARARGLVGAGASAEQEAAAVQKLLAQEVLSKVEVGEAEVERYYHEHPDEFAQPERVTLRQILVPTLQQARDARRRLQKDSKGFALLAQSLSRAPEASAGGLMGTFARGELPAELEQAAFAMHPGQTSDIVQTPLGFHILRLESRPAARQLSLEETRGALRARLLEKESDRKVREFVAGLLARAKVNHEAGKAHLRSH